MDGTRPMLQRQLQHIECIKMSGEMRGASTALHRAGTDLQTWTAAHRQAGNTMRLLDVHASPTWQANAGKS